MRSRSPTVPGWARLLPGIKLRPLRLVVHVRREDLLPISRDTGTAIGPNRKSRAAIDGKTVVITILIGVSSSCRLIALHRRDRGLIGPAIASIMRCYMI